MNKMKKRLVLILNGKGGVGKSFFAVNFIQYLKDRDIAHAAFDSDDENSTLKRFHSEVGFIDPNTPTDMDRMVEPLEDRDVVVVDCRAAFDVVNAVKRSASFPHSSNPIGWF